MLKQGRIQNFSSGVVGVQVHKKTDNVFFSFLFYKGGPFTESSIRGPIVYSLENWETNFFSFFSVAGGGGGGGGADRVSIFSRGSQCLFLYNYYF